MSDSEETEMSDGSDVYDDLIKLGKSSAFQTIEWHFPNTTKCPISECGLSCSDRNVALAHFHLLHAATSMICTICNEVYSVTNPLKLLIHYQTQHPNERPPQLKQDDDSSLGNASNEHNADNEVDILNTPNVETTCWQLPERQTHCPMETCKAAFETSADAIEHYKQEHSDKLTYCYLCEKPIRIYQSDDFIGHLHQHHPGQKSPSIFENSQTHTDVQVDEENRTEESTDENESNDMITLHALGVTTQWKFPDSMKNCPVSTCSGRSFANRSAAIAHYKAQHAERSILCPICDKPIATHSKSDFTKHYRLKHPDVKRIPFNLGQQSKRSTNEAEQTIGKTSKGFPSHQKMDPEVDDLITLSGGGHITQWQFPQLTLCPALGCRMSFPNRNETIAHYKERHAMNAILCSICDKPIGTDTNSASEFVRHYRDSHPYTELPIDFEDTPHDEVLTESDLITLEGLGQSTKWRFPSNLTQCPHRNCRKQFGTYSNAIAHYKEFHTKNSVVCSICNTPIYAGSKTDLVGHCKRNHPTKIPIEFKNILNPKDENIGIDDDLIILQGCGQITQWRFPDTKKCPVANCRRNFETRSDAIAHYKERHAKVSILCAICDKPFWAVRQTDLNKHYRMKHPRLQIPALMDGGINHSKPQANEIRPLERNGPGTDVDDEEDDDEDDIIVLKGCGQTTQWRFPMHLKNCPVRNCKTFGVRSDAIRHYKRCHTKNNIYCEYCDKPIYARYMSEFRLHFQRNHPKKRIDVDQSSPSQKDVVPSTKIKKENPGLKHVKSNNMPDELDDLITLSGGNQISKWRFPTNLNRCPLHQCGSSFDTRTDAITHFRTEHAKNVVKCPKCNSVFKTGSLSRHLKEVHGSRKIICPLKGCSYETKRVYILRTHWSQHHPHLSFPEMRDESSFTYTMDNSNQSMDKKSSVSSTSSSSSVSLVDLDPGQDAPICDEVAGIASNGKLLQSSNSVPSPYEASSSEDDDANIQPLESSQSSQLSDARNKVRSSKRKRESSESYSSESNSTDDEISEVEEFKRRKRDRDLRRLTRSSGNKNRRRCSSSYDRSTVYFKFQQ